MLPDPGKNVAEIVRADYRAADVFKKHGINYCCSGEVSIEEACRARNIDPTLVLREIEASTRDVVIPNGIKFEEWRLDFLIDFVTNIYHAYLSDAIPEVEARLNSFIKGHGKKFPELLNISETFGELSTVLRAHNEHEDNIVFPYLKQIDTAFRKKESYANLFVRTLRKPQNHVEKEHQDIKRLLEKLEADTNHFSFPEKACTNHQVLYRKLKELHDNVLQHKYIENAYLYPKAFGIEQELLRL